MTNRTTLQVLLDKTEVAYRTCWQVLRGMKVRDASPTFISGLLDFQSILARALFNLDSAYRQLEQEREHLVTRKSLVKPDWFLQTIRRLGKYQEVIADASNIGKAMGDAFAWFFYSNERDLLRQHVLHEPITELPTGIGRAGEFAFINNVKIQNGHLILYHGITSILRNGDVSFVDLRTLRVSCLGEIKSKKTGPDRVEVTLHVVGGKERPMPFTVSESSEATPPVVMPTLPGKMKDRLERQMKAMADSFKPFASKANIGIDEDTYIPVVNRIAETLSKTDVAYEQCGDGLLLAGFQLGTKSLFAGLMATKDDMTKKLNGLREQVVKICDKAQADSPDNANGIVISALGAGILPGTVPLCWWAISPELVEKLFFQDIVVVTVYNPVHLIGKLRRMGYQVKLVENGRRHSVTKTIGEGRLEVHGFEYFKSLVQSSLMREESVLQMIGGVDNLVESGKIGPRTRIDLNICQQLGRPEDVKDNSDRDG